MVSLTQNPSHRSQKHHPQKHMSPSKPLRKSTITTTTITTTTTTPTPTNTNLNIYATAPFKSLSTSQFQSYKELKALIASDPSASWPVSRVETSGISERNDEFTLLRYLKARSFDANAAYKQYKATAKWRKDLHLTDSYDEVEVETFEAIRRLFPQWTGRRSKSGHPVFGYVVSEIQTADLLTASQADPRLLSVFMPAEHSTEFVYPLCSHLSTPSRTSAKKPITAAVNIIDLSRVGVKHFWSLRNHLQKASTMATAYYPESVERIFVIGAPSFFPTVWGFITRWFDASTTGKIVIVPNGKERQTLEQDIAVEDIPTRWGGELEWEFGGQPVFDERTKETLGGREEIRGPVRIVHDGAEEHQLVAVGTVDGKERRDVLGRVDVPGAQGGDEESDEDEKILEVVIEKQDSADTVEF